jgi:plastocyanin
LGLASKALPLAAAMVCAAAPALAYRADATITAVDFAFRANGTDAKTLTIAPGQTVTFSYPVGKSTHNVVFTGPKPTCSGLPPFPYPPQLWKDATCTFDQPGTYAFVCGAHPEMTGTIVVAAPAPSPTATPTETADPDPVAPGATPAPTATPEPATESTPKQQQPATLSLKLAGRQKGTRVRGSLNVAQAPARVEVTLRSGKTKAGSWTRTSAAAGRVSFSVALNARTRKALRAKRHLKLTVSVALTPRGGKTLTTTGTATVSL